MNWTPSRVELAKTTTSAVRVAIGHLRLTIRGAAASTLKTAIAGREPAPAARPVSTGPENAAKQPAAIRTSMRSGVRRWLNLAAVQADSLPNQGAPRLPPDSGDPYAGAPLPCIDGNAGPIGLGPSWAEMNIRPETDGSSWRCRATENR